MSPWDENLTKLNSILSELYPQKEQSYRIVDRAGIPSGSISFKDASLDNWYYILKEANRKKKVDLLVQIASDEYPERMDLKELFTRVNNKEVLQTASNFEAEKLKEFIANSRPDLALKTLNLIGKEISNDFHNQIVIESARLAQITRDNNKGILSTTNYQIERNRINYSLLELIDAVPKETQLNAFIEKNNVSTTSNLSFDLLIPNKADLQKIIGTDDLMDINWLEKALKASKSVCKVLVSNGEAGTGFIIEGGYLFTNNHVIPDVGKASQSKIIFNYKIDLNNNVITGTEYLLDSSFFYTSPENILDFSVVKIIDNTNSPLSDWGFLEFEKFQVPKINDKVNIIQHPDGKYMKIALPDVIISTWNQYLFYVADTKEGSSGSPVFNQDWNVIGIHHAGNNKEEEGLRINEQGDIKLCNRGIYIKKIIEDLNANNIVLTN